MAAPATTTRQSTPGLEQWFSNVPKNDKRTDVVVGSSGSLAYAPHIVEYFEHN
jgi:hypothetical protein